MHEMKIGVMKEIKPSEYRVAAVPSAVAELVRRGHEVFVEHDAGKGSGFSDDDYREAGATVEANIVKNGKAKKIYVFKMKRKKNERKKKGHRQPFTKVEITKINA